MSTAPMPALDPNPLPPGLPPAFHAASSLVGGPNISVRRRLDRQNGQALEQIGHAIEYLIDSRALFTGSVPGEAVDEAIEILSRASRAVFSECPEIVPRRRKLSLWLRYHLSTTHAERSTR